VLDTGRISYYEKASGINEPPYGMNLKGSMALDNVNIQHATEEESEVESNPNRIYLIDSVTGVDLLISAADADECVLWKSLLKKHIEFSNKYPGDILPIEDVGCGKAKRRWSLFSVRILHCIVLLVL
jgi:hypothetical protein